jgi:hypothetical protein
MHANMATPEIKVAAIARAFLRRTSELPLKAYAVRFDRDRGARFRSV